MHAAARLAATQHGKVHYQQLLQIGMSPRSVECAAAAGLLIRERRAVYAVGHVPDTAESRWSGAVLAAGPGAALSHLAAARHWGMLPWEPKRIDVTRPHQGRSLRGVECHSSSLDGDTEILRGIHVTSPMRTVADCARLLSEGQLAAVLREARHAGLLDITALEELSRPGCRRRGAPRLRATLDQFAGNGRGFRSRLEDRSRKVLVLRGAPEPLLNVAYRTDVGMVEVDLSWPDLNVCVEVDGPTHDDAAQQRIDRRNRAALRRAGWYVVVIHHAAFEESATAATNEAMAAIRAAMNMTLPTAHVGGVVRNS